LHVGFNLDPMIFAHNISHRSTESFLIHDHSTYELHYFVRGSAQWLVEGVEYPCEPHTMTLFPPNVFHGIRIYDEQPYERFTLHFTADNISLERRAVLSRKLPRAEKTGGIPCLMKNMEETALHALLLELDALASHDEQTREKLTPVFLEALISTIVLAASPEIPAAESASMTPAQETIIAYLNRHFTEPITLDDLAERFFISKHHLNRSFRKVTGTTVRDYLISSITEKIPYIKLNGHPTDRLPGNVNFSFNFIEGESLLLMLDLNGIAASSGSACTSGSLDPSHVLLALGLPHEIAHGSLRLSIGDQNTKEEIDTVISVLPGIVKRLRDMSPLYEEAMKNQ